MIETYIKEIEQFGYYNDASSDTSLQRHLSDVIVYKLELTLMQVLCDSTSCAVETIKDAIRIVENHRNVMEMTKEWFVNCKDLDVLPSDLRWYICKMNPV